MTADEKIAELRLLYDDFGQNAYTEACSKQSHMEQCATAALEHGESEEMQLAAFLHDVGHLLAEYRQIEERDELGFHNHSELGAEYLEELGFASEIVSLVRFHVQAKRYLAAVDSDYLAHLSAASLATLKQQGGPMNCRETAAFAEHVNLAELLRLRRLDDLGKAAEADTRKLDHWLELGRRHLEARAPALAAV